MSNSSLVDYTKFSPNYSTRTAKIDKITIHHMAGILTVEQCGDIFANSKQQASSNYGIDGNGRVGLYVSESNRSWASSNSYNDNRAVTIEVANSKVGNPWPVNDVAYEKLIQLCVDICQRNGIAFLNYTGNSYGNLTMHKMFTATACPGPYLEERFPAIAEEVNKRLKNGSIYPVQMGDEDMTYEQFKQFMNQYLNEADSSNPSSWAKDACDKAIKKGILKGDGKGAYNWQKPLTREAFLVLQERMGLLK